MGVVAGCGVDEFVHDLSPTDDLDVGDAECPIDRESDCLVDDAEGCDGYPSAGPAGWGYTVGERFENVVLSDCEGNERELAELLRADDGPLCEDGYASAVVVEFGARWCDSCVSEAKTIAHAYKQWRDQGVHLVNVLVGVEAWEGGTPELCERWPFVDEDDEPGVVPFPVWFANGPTAKRLEQYSVGRALPLRVFVDANANIRDVYLGEAPSPEDEIDARLEPILNDPFWTERD